MTNITKAAQDALAELADWHWGQAATLRKAASTSAMDKPEPCQSSLTRMADWHDAQKSLIRAALQDEAVEVRGPSESRVCRSLSTKSDRQTVLSISDAVRVCPYKDADCGDRPANWCDTCPKRHAQQPAPVVPDGFVLVPVEPTEAMIQAGIGEMPHFTDEPGPVWSAMIAASQQK